MAGLPVLLFHMRFQPREKSGFVQIAGGGVEDERDQLLILIGKRDAVDGQKHQHGVGADALVSVRRYHIETPQENDS